VPILREGELDIISHSVEQTQRLGIRLGSLLQPGDVICLSGDMGAGKTMFSVGIGRGWGSRTPLTSPTYTLIHEHRHEHEPNKRLYHLDCYRLSGPEEAEQLGLDDILTGRGPVIFEWPEHIETALPAERLWIDLRVLEPTRRTFVFTAVGERYETLLNQFRQTTFGS
jgi:tRNA threonylcarbamoyladenosine biosynthesis protein TsaE